MLERMGWSEDKGLGKEEDGTKEPIRIAKKRDNSGLNTNQRTILVSYYVTISSSMWLNIQILERVYKKLVFD